MKAYSWNSDKNDFLRKTRNISFEEVLLNIQLGNEVDVFDHPNQERYPGQKISVVVIEGYAYLVPYVETDEEIFLKLSFPVEKQRSNIQVSPMARLNSEEKEILDAFEKGVLKRSRKAKKEIEQHKAIAEATFKKDARINIRLTSKDLRALQALALKEGIPYQTLVSSVLHKYVDGQLIDKTANNTP